MFTSSFSSHFRDAGLEFDYRLLPLRQSLYKQMTESNILPPSDALDLNKGYTCLVGTTEPLDPAKFPVVTEKDNGGVLVIGNNNSWVVKNRILTASCEGRGQCC